MAIVYLTPEDLTVSQTATVLNFLNSATSAEEIASSIEIADELDVGLRVGQRILDARAQLENGFINLQQLMDVKQVGPERFTEIVALLTGMVLPQFKPQTLDALWQRYLQDHPRAAASAAGGSGREPYRIEVIPPPAAPWLGQEVACTVKVSASDSGRPVANLPVTLESNNLMLTTAFGFDVRHGQIIHTRTATDGSVRLRLNTAISEQLNHDQHSALMQALRDMDSNAETPAAMQSELLNLVQRYQDSRNRDLRAAIDMVYRQFGRQLGDSQNPLDYLHRWRYFSGLLRIYPGVNSVGFSSVPVAASTAGVGVYHCSWKHWLLPWYQLYQSLLSGNNLQQLFRAARDRDQSESMMSAEILGEAYLFAARHNGAVADALSKKVIDREMRTFLAREVSNLPAAAQKSLYPSLTLAGQSISSSNAGTLALVSQTRVEVETRIDEKVGAVTLNADEILASIDSLSSRLNRYDDQISGLQTQFSRLDLQVGQLDTQLLGLNADFGNLQSSFDTLQVNFSDVDLAVNTLEGRVNTLDSRIGGLDTRVNSINRDVSTLNDNAVLRSDTLRDASGNIINVQPRNRL